MHHLAQDVGHGIKDYREMFDLTDEALKSKILDISNDAYAMNDNYLPYDDFSFDIALSADCLFVNLKDKTVEDHLAMIRELARVAKEVRIFPLIDKEGKTSEFLGPVLLALQHKNYGVEVKQVDFPLHQSGNAMLRVWAQQCNLD